MRTESNSGAPFGGTGGVATVTLRGILGMSLLMAGLWGSAVAEPAERVRVLLRYDDYTRDSSATLERALLTELDRLRVPLLVGVVPFLEEPYPAQTAEPAAAWAQTNLGAEKIGFLRSLLPAGRIEVALHGFSHRTNFIVSGQDSEFAGLGLQRQRALLTLGRAALERTFGVPVRVFTPPFNAFDGTTLRAMEQTGFQVLSAGLVALDKPSSLAYVPGTVYPQKMRDAIETALTHKVDGKLVVVVMHPYDFAESEDEIPPFRGLRRKISVRQMLEDIRWAEAQPGVRFVSLSAELEERGELSAARIEANARLRGSWVRKHMLLPTALVSPPTDGALLPTALAQRMFWKETLLAAGVFAGLTLGAFALSRYLNALPVVGRGRGAQKKLLAGLLPTLIVVSLFQGLYFFKAALLVLGVGWYAGISSSKFGRTSVA